jgi:hypothetical protein
LCGLLAILMATARARTAPDVPLSPLLLLVLLLLLLLLLSPLLLLLLLLAVWVPFVLVWEVL